MANKNNHLVVSYFENRHAAEAAVESLKKWDKANDDIKLGAIAILTLDERGLLTSEEVGQRDTKTGALWGAAIGAAAGILTAGIGLIPAVLVGTAAGGGLGALNHKNLGMSDEDRDSMVDQLRHGAAALAVMADAYEVVITREKMVELGGKTQMFEVPTVTAEALRSTAAIQADAASAVEAAVAGSDWAVSGASAVLGNLSQDAISKLGAAGVMSASSLLKLGATQEARAALAEKTGLSLDDITAGVRKLDMMRLKGVGPKTAGLFLASGVQSAADLGLRKPENLVQKLAEVNENTGLMSDLPTEKELAGWVEAAKSLPNVVAF